MDYTLLDYCGSMTPDGVVTTINNVGLAGIVNLDEAIHYVLSDGYVIVHDNESDEYEVYSTEHSEEGFDNE